MPALHGNKPLLWNWMALGAAIIPPLVLGTLQPPLGRTVLLDGQVVIQATLAQQLAAVLCGMGSILVLIISWTWFRRLQNAPFLVLWTAFLPALLYLIAGFCLTKTNVGPVSFTLPEPGWNLLATQTASWDRVVALMLSEKSRGTKEGSTSVTVYLENGESFTVPFGTHTKRAWPDLAAEAKRHKVLIDRWD